MAETAPDLQLGFHEAKVREHLTEVLSSPHFAHAPQLRNFLEFLVERTLCGQEDELKEMNLGHDVFRRGPGYDPRADAIVRVQASILRKRLCAYYEHEGQDSPIRISLPKGGYIPSFLRSDVTQGAVEEPEPLPAPPPQIPPPVVPLAAPAVPEPTRRRFFGTAAAFLVGATVMGGASSLWNGSKAKKRDAAGASVLDFDAAAVSPRIWGELLDQERPTQLAFGCPQFFSGGGYYVRDINVNALQTEDASNRMRDLTKRLDVYLSPAPHTYTGVGEMMGIHRVTQFLTRRGVEAPLENVQRLSQEAIENRNLILVSSHRFRTFLDLLDLPKRINSDYGETGGFAVKDIKGEIEQKYMTRSSGGLSVSYGLISFWRHPPTKGRILVLSGIESWATYAAAEFMTNPERLGELETAIGDSFRSQHDGMQVLVRIEGHVEEALHTRYLTHRIV